MLKFTIFDSPKQFSKTRFIEAIQERVKFSQGVDISLHSTKEQSYVIVEANNKHIVGVAYLLKKVRKDIPEELKDILGGNEERELWECSSIYLDVSICSLALGIVPLGRILAMFYQDIYEKFVEFGVKRNLNFISIKLLPEIYDLTKTIGGWPYVVGLSPQHSSDGLFHGILPLSGSRYEFYRSALKGSP